MRFVRLVAAAVCALVIQGLTAQPVSATTILFRSDAELVAASERVIHARVLRQRTERPNPQGAIYTITTLAVLEDFTGIPGDVVEVRELGGAFGGEYMYVGGGVEYKIGSEIVVMLQRGRLGLHSAAMGLSKFDITADGSLVRNTRDTNVVGGRAALSAQTIDNLRGLVERVRGTASHRNESAATMLPEMSASAPFTFLTFDNGLSPRWTQADSGASVNWYRNTNAPSPLGSGNSDSEIQVALSAWHNQPGSSLKLSYQGTTTLNDATIPGGSAVILYEDPDNEIDNNSSTLALGGGWAFFGGGGTVNGVTFNKYDRGYIIFQNASVFCGLSATFCQSQNFTRVLEHEMGHVIGLGHSDAGQANIMYPSCCVAATPVAPALGPDDRAGLIFIYPSGSAPPPPPPPPPPCTYSLSAASAASAPAGGMNFVTVTTQAGCQWTAVTNASFITVTSGASGTGTGTVAYSVAASAAVEPRVGTLTIAGTTFSVTQNGTGPTMALNKTSLNFGATTNGQSFNAKTGTQTVRLSQSGAGTVTWTASSNQPWLTVSPTSGTGPATFSISVSYVNGLPPAGTTPGSISLSLHGAGTTAGPIPVNLVTKLYGTSIVPAGAFETPLTNSTGVTGSIAVTGWALDDTEVSRVRIVRDPVAGEAPGLVFIGNAAFVEGSRPDVAAQFPASPRSMRAGWGYLLLTNFLPAGGNGTFVLHAVADDAEGNSTLLGSKVITTANATATRPFGAIDTPAQGETVSGTSYNNFGWVLSPGTRRADPLHGGTVQVFIDGGFVGVPIGWSSRSDLTQLFPAANYAGVVNAQGVFTFNPSALTEGTHTIHWVVTDNQAPAGADGVGSRFFTVSSTTGPLTSGVTESASRKSVTLAAPDMMMPVRAASLAAAPLLFRDEIAAARLDASPIAGRRGFDVATPLRAYPSGANGLIVVNGEELDRFELQLNGTGASQFTGYLRVGETVTPLPIGSRLDPSTGAFTWQPGVGFAGNYDIVFVQWAQGRALARQEVRFVLHPKGSNRVGPQVVIDAPTPGTVVGSSFLVAGWAIDLDDTVGTGVDTLHAWAYPVDGSAPIFVGAAAYGGVRTDVAEIFGERFRESGYGLRVQGLAPGTYDVAVFAWSTVQNGFVPAKVVRVTVQ